MKYCRYIAVVGILLLATIWGRSLLAGATADSPVYIRSDFSPRKDGQPSTAWKLSSRTTIRETMHLSGDFEVTSEHDARLATLALDYRGLAGRKMICSVFCGGAEQTTAGVVLVYKTAAGQTKQHRIFWDQPLTPEPARVETRFAIPDDAEQLTAIELHRSSGAGRVFFRDFSLLDDGGVFNEIKEFTQSIDEYRHPVGEPAPASGIRWASPLARGPLKALIFIDNRMQRGIIELAHRIELDYDFVWMREGTLLASGADRINARLGGADRAYDVILVCAPEFTHEALAQAIRRQVRGGAGLVYVTGYENDKQSVLRDVLPPIKVLTAADAAPDFLKHVPWQHFPTVPNNYIFSGSDGDRAVMAAGDGTFGDGRVVLLQYGRPAGVYNALLPHAGHNPSALRDWWEYAYSLLAKSILHAAQRSESGAITSVTADPADANVRISVAGLEGQTARVQLRWDDGLSRALDLETQEQVAGAAGELAFPVPASIASANGLRIVNVFLKDKDGRVIDWATATRSVTGQVVIAPSSGPQQRAYPHDQPVAFPLIVRNDHASRTFDLSITADLIDARNRLVWSDRRTANVAPGQSHEQQWSADVQRSIVPGHTLRITLRDGENVLDWKQWPLSLPALWRSVTDDFRAGLYGDFYRRTHTDEVFWRWARELGFGFVVEGGAVENAPQLDLAWFDFGVAHKGFHHNNGTEAIRVPCLSDPQQMKQIIADAVNEAFTSADNGAMLISMADESELVRNGWAEVCFSEHCAARFRDWVRSSYGDLGAVNRQWGTDFTDWNQVGPIRAEQARARGNFAQWADFRVFMEEVWTSAFVAVKDAIKQRHPDAKVSFTNPFQTNPFSGSDTDLLARAEDFFGKYMREDVIKEYRSFGPDKLQFTHWGYLENIEFCAWYPWYFAFNGGDLMAFYDTVSHIGNYDLFDGTFRETRRGQVIRQSQADLLRGVGKILHDTPAARSPIAVLHSQSSMRTSWIESDLQVGFEAWDQWTMNRLPIDNPFALHTKSVQNAKAMVRHAQMQPTFLAPRDIAAGALKEHQVLILPGSVSISDATLSEIAGFVAGGGTVVADLRTAVYDEHSSIRKDMSLFESLFGLRRPSPAKYETGRTALVAESDWIPASASAAESAGEPLVAAWERIELITGKPHAKYADGTPAFIVNAYGGGRAIYLNAFLDDVEQSSAVIRRIAEIAGVKQPVQFTVDGKPAIGVECYLYENAPMTYVGILRDMLPMQAEQRTWYESDFRQAGPRPAKVNVRLDQTYHVYAIRAGKYLGHTQSPEIELVAGQAELLGMLPYKVARVAMEIDGASYSPGQPAAYQVAVIPESPAAPAGDHVLRVEVIGPDGQVVPHYGANVSAPGGVYRARLPLALNEQTGQWLIRATDVVSGIAAEASFIVAPPN